MTRKQRAFKNRFIKGPLPDYDHVYKYGSYRAKARKTWLCWRCAKDIKKGELYIRHIEYTAQGSRIYRYHNEWSYLEPCAD